VLGGREQGAVWWGGVVHIGLCPSVRLVNQGQSGLMVGFMCIGQLLIIGKCLKVSAKGSQVGCWWHLWQVVCQGE